MYHVKDVAYLSKRVTDPRAFCLRLLLMCCELANEEWKQLLPVEPIDVDLKENEDENEEKNANKYSSSQQQGETIGSSNNNNNNNNSNKNNKSNNNNNNNNNNTKNSKKNKKSNNKDNNSSSNKKSCQISANKVPEVRYGTFDLDEEEAHDRRLRDITNLLRWDAKCKGFTYLCEEELDKHNDNVKVSKLSTWK